jgi:aminoacyl tRNA synthase complex-interacting multifunctional protein 1
MKGKVIVMANLKPKPLGGFESNGMVVCASDIDHKNVEILVPDGPIGERLYL